MPEGTVRKLLPEKLGSRLIQLQLAEIGLGRPFQLRLYLYLCTDTSEGLLRAPRPFPAAFLSVFAGNRFVTDAAQGSCQVFRLSWKGSVVGGRKPCWQGGSRAYARTRAFCLLSLISLRVLRLYSGLRLEKGKKGVGRNQG